MAKIKHDSLIPSSEHGPPRRTVKQYLQDPSCKGGTGDTMADGMES